MNSSSLLGEDYRDTHSKSSRKVSFNPKTPNSAQKSHKETANSDIGNELKLPPVYLPKYSNMPTGTVTPFLENQEYADFVNTNILQKRKDSKASYDEGKSPDGRSVRFYSSQAYINSHNRKMSVLDKEEKIWPFETNDKSLQEHFVSL